MNKASKNKQIIILISLFLVSFGQTNAAQKKPNKLVEKTTNMVQIDDADGYPSAPEDNVYDDGQIEQMSQNMDNTSPISHTPQVPNSQKRPSQPMITLTPQEWHQLQLRLNRATELEQQTQQQEQQQLFNAIERNNAQQSSQPILNTTQKPTPKNPSTAGTSVATKAKLKKEHSLVDSAKAIAWGLVASYCLKFVYNKFFYLAQTLTNIIVDDIETFNANSRKEEHQLVAQVTVNNLINRIFATFATIILFNFFTNIQM